MMISLLQFPQILPRVILPLVMLAGVALPLAAAAAGDEPFRDLPGVKMPRQERPEDRTVCTSYMDSRDPGRWRRTGLAKRVYTCETEPFEVRSYRPPNEIEWQKRKNYYKPWITDGF